MKARNRRVGPGRSALQRHARERGKHRSNLWLQYGSKIGRDVVLHSDVEYEHFLWLEADYEISSYELEPTPHIVALGLDNVRTRFDALVILRNGTRQLQLATHTQLIHNWRRCAAFIAAAREIPIAPYENEMMLAANRERSATLAALLDDTDPTLEPLYLAALFSPVLAHLRR